MQTEALFKLALEEKRYGEVMRAVKSSRLCGQAIIAYLQQKGWVRRFVYRHAC